MNKKKINKIIALIIAVLTAIATALTQGCTVTKNVEVTQDEKGTTVQETISVDRIQK